MKLLSMAASVLFLVLPVTSVAKAHGCQNAASIASAAHQLDNAANHFHHVIENVSGYSHLAGDVHELAYAANDFHHSVEFASDCYTIQEDFHNLSHEFEHVRNAFYRAHNIHHNQHVVQDWYNLQYAYNRVYNAVYRTN